ncbi:MAG: hypothetical protein ABL958_20340 [Bdellovibrionia bacterium]
MTRSTVIFALVFGVQAVSSGTEPAKPAPKTTVTALELAQREAMVKISRQLGVTCNHCHDVKDFKDAKLENFKIAKEHMRVVELLNTQGFTGKKAPKADCFMCHRGKAMPDYKEPR